MKKSIEYLEQDSYRDFLERHELRDTPLLERDIQAIYWVSLANIMVHHAYSNLSNDIFESDPTVGWLLSMLDRVFEYLEGAIIAFNTGNPTSAEVISRAAIESSVIVQYILEDDRTARLAAYFENYISAVGTQLKKWRDLTNKMSGIEAQAHQEALQTRSDYLDGMTEFVESQITFWRTINNSDIRHKWPQSIYDQFVQIGEESAYRTVYARLSSRTHSDAEDVLTYYLMVSQGNKILLEKAADEAVNYSRFMVYIALEFYLKASLRYSETFRLNIVESLKMGLAIIDHQIQLISSEIGAY